MESFFEPLSAEKILTMLEPHPHFKLECLEVFETIDSTNTYLLEKSKTESSGWICFAEQQTSARGRRGRVWSSPRGSNIACSLLWQLPDELLNVSGIAIAVAVMVVRALKKYGVTASIQLKWPNDVLFAGRKFAGILLERRANNLVIGIGLNVDLPKPIDPAWIDLNEIIGQPIARNHLAGLLVNELLNGLAKYKAEGLFTFIDEWQQHDFLSGKKVTVHTPDRNILGIAQGINEQGELLVLDSSHILQKFCYGEVSVRPFQQE